jgi:hypothetical protein
MDRLKHVGMELAKISKNEDGFTAYRNIWKKNVAKDQVVEEEEENENEEKEKEG